MLTPEQIAASGTEEAHQKAFMQWIALTGMLIDPDLKRLHHIPNGGDRSPSVAAAMKAAGVKRGVPDLFWPKPIGIFAGFYMELKKPGQENKALGGRSSEQKEWHEYLIRQHYAVATTYGWLACVKAWGDYRQGLMQMPPGGDCLFVSA